MMVNPSWLTLTWIKILHIEERHLLKNEILPSQQKLDNYKVSKLLLTLLTWVSYFE